MQKQGGSEFVWSKFAFFTLIVGLISGIFSVVSDHLPIGNLTIPQVIVSYLAVTINSLPMWFILAMLVGYLFADNVKMAALLGCMYTVAAITFYFLLGNLFTDIPISVSFKEKTDNYAVWYAASAAGGISGGMTGFSAQKTPFALLILMAGLILQLLVNGSNSWKSVVGITQNMTFCLLIMGIMMRLIVSKMRMPNEKIYTNENR